MSGFSFKRMVLATGIFLTAAALALALSSASVPGASANSESSVPKQVHLSWSTNDVHHTMTVMWWTEHENSGNYVVYDTEHRDFPENYDFSTEGKAFQIDPEEGVNGRKVKVDWNGWYHETELTGLEPGTTYHFRVGGSGGWSREWKFRTIGLQENIKFVIGGDSRKQWENWPRMRNIVTSSVAAENPDFIVFTGDMISQGGDQSEWDNWFKCFEQRLVKDNRMIPMIPIVGNHEMYSPAVSPASTYAWFKGVFANPGNELWYSLDFPNLHITALCTTDAGWSAGVEAVRQEDWLERDLIQSDAEWKIAAFHIPWYSTSYKTWPPDGEASYMYPWAPILENPEYGVDLVATAHQHSYERFYPLRTSVQEERAIVSMKWAYREVQDNAWGVDYFIQGGWGAPLRGFERSAERTITKASKCGYTLIEVRERRMNLFTKDALGKFYDGKTFIVPEKITNLTLNKIEISPGENVTVSATVKNTTKSRVTPTIEVKIERQTVKSKTVALSPEENKEVSFKVTRETPQDYQVSVGNLSKSFTVKVEKPWFVDPDDEVGLSDLMQVAGRFGETGTPGWIPSDVDGDGEIGLSDLMTVAGHWGETR